ncbi:MAG: type I-E CRISPR-associated protein Cas6/Cse3/CasE [Nitrospinota bacterium]
MYFSKIQLRKSGLDIKNRAAMRGGGDYEYHKYLWKLFGKTKDQNRNFIYRRQRVNGWPLFYAVSENVPEDSDGLWEIDFKKYTPKLNDGMRLSFSLTANPVRTEKIGDTKKRKRHDVVMDAKHKLKEQGVKKEDFPSMLELMQKTGYEWLNSRAEKNGFSLDERQVRVDGYDQKRFYKKTGEVRYSTLDFEGLLTVIDPGLFLRTLYHGIGPAKSFGCGLMLVRPA